MYRIQNKKFDNLYGELCRSHNRYDVFSDFVKMSAISIYNSFAKNEKLEEEYLRTIKHYQKEEQELFTKMFAELIMMYDDAEKISDILGPLYMDISRDKHLGQVFTPTHISHFMARIMALEHELEKAIKEDGFISMQDPACGSGRNGIVICRSIKRTKYQLSRIFTCRCN